MADYRALYFKLFRAQNKAMEVLAQAHREAEEAVISSLEPAGPPQEPGSGFRNRETSGVFVYKIDWPHAEIKSGDVRFADEWHGAWLTDALVHREWVAKPFLLTTLLRMHEETPQYFCDALARCLAAPLSGCLYGVGP